MSDWRARSRKTSFPLGVRRSRPRESLFRPYWIQDSDTLSGGARRGRTGRRVRVGSEKGGENGGPSTWMTSAPNSPR